VKGLFSAKPSAAAGEVWTRLLAGENILETKDPLAGAMQSLYGPFIHPQKTPFVVAQLGQSLDGYIATESGASHYVTGPQSLTHLHRMRALSDAVIVGWRTVAADDPQLTVRNVEGKDPLRVVIDTEGKLPASHKIFASHAPGALRLTGKDVAPLGDVKSEALDLVDGRADPKSVIELLVAKGCKNILIEGGGAIVSSFLEAGVLDRLHLGIAPLLIGKGRRGITRTQAATLQEATRLKGRQYEMGSDVLFDFDLS
jgi:diaminohydroxyphosphoribosylaminopyrimidine deaminase/5-amino-6-(5-phosphoribosylamino)uracil reductase